MRACEKHLGQAELLRQLERVLDPLERELVPPGEVEEPRDLRRERREALVRLLAGEDGERTLHALDAFLEPPAVPHHLRQARRHARGGMRFAGVLEELDRPLPVGRGLVRAGPRVGRQARPLVELACVSGSSISSRARSNARCASAVAASDAARSAARTSISPACARISPASGSLGAASYASR